MSKENSPKLIAFCETVIRWGLYAFVFLLPLFFMPFNTNVLELNKQLLLIVFCLVLLIAWLGKMIAEGKMEIKKSWLNLGIVFFLIFYLISSILSKNTYQSLVGFGGTVGESLFSVLALVIIFFVLVNNLKDREELLNLAFVLVCSGILVGLFGGLQLLEKFILPWGFTKTTGFNTVGSANALEIFLASLMVLSAILFTESDIVRWRKIFYGLAAGLFLLLVLSINFVNVWWVLLITTIFVISLGIINREQINQYRLILPMLILAFAVLMLLPVRLNIFTWFSVPLEVSPSLTATLDINKQVLKEKLFFGMGPGNYSYAYGLYRDISLNQTDFWNVRFNQGLSKIFSQPVVLGLSGWLVWLSIVISFAVYGLIALIRRRGKNWVLALAAFASWFLLAFLQFFYATNLTLEFAFWTTLGMSFLALKTIPPKWDENKEVAIEKIPSMAVEFERTSPMASILSFVFVLVLVLTISVLYLGGSYYYADILYQKGATLVSEKNDLENGTVKIRDAVMLNPYNDLYLRTLSQAALLRVNQELTKSQSAERDTQIQNFIATAINIGKRSTDLSPLNIDNWVQRASIYRAVMGYIAGAEQWAFDAYQEATRLEPQNPFYYLELGRTYVLAADILSPTAQKDKEKEAKVVEYLTKAEEAFNKSISVKADYAPALFQLALVFDRQGKLDEAIAKMTQTKNAYPQDIGVAFQLGLLYYKKASWSLARAEFERAILIDQNYSNARYFLGLIYDKQGNRAAAVEQFEKIEQLNPDNQDVKNILANLRAGKSASGEIPQKPAELPLEEKIPQEK
jgi:tetratricopeptide (TPR) repeat protein